MKSAHCRCEDHEYCTKNLIQQNGKKFRCDCNCHPVEVVKPKEVEEDDEWEDS
jgi:hypothetical protein